MKSTRRKRRGRYGRMMQLASFGDIAFQLVIFFVLTSSFAKDSRSHLDLAQANQLDELRKPKVLVEVDKENQIWLNGYEVDGAKTVEVATMELYKDVEEASDRVVHFKCHNEASKSIFEPVIDSLAKAGTMIAIIGEEGEPE